MAALVQSFPQQSSTGTMLQGRPSSASGILQNTSQGHQYGSGSAMARNSYHNLTAAAVPPSYRGQGVMAPIAPYAFTATPGLRPPQAPHAQMNQRTSSAPSVPTMQGQEAMRRSQYAAAVSISTTSSSSSSGSSGHRGVARDDSAISSQGWATTTTRAPRPHSTIFTSATMQPHLAPPSPTTAKISPERYRRPANRRTESSPGTQTPPAVSSSSQMTLPVNQLQTLPSQLPNFQPMSAFQAYVPQMPATSIFGPVGRSATDDFIIQRPVNQAEMNRNRRRSIHTLDMPRPHITATFASPGLVHPLRSSPVDRPVSSSARNHSNERNPSKTHSRSSSATKREPSTFLTPSNPAQPVHAHASSPKHDHPQNVNIPARGSSSSDVAKRLASPSPLSKPATMSSGQPATKDSFASAVNAALQTPTKQPTTSAQPANGVQPQSPAAKQLAALNDKDAKKSKSSRLRRAFSFGSAAELRKASGEATASNGTADTTDADARSRLRKEKFQEQQDAEQARIAKKQEEGGIGSGIYSGQGRYYSGSTDNLSISSTASSASIMIRKMGKGMKKSTRSLVGLFRPKSVIGVPAADNPVPSYAEVSMVNVEAERERVNVNANPHDQSGGGTGFPRLGRNSIDASKNASTVETSGLVIDTGSTSDVSRKSGHGGEKERAEVLAAVKGILKRSGTGSASSSPVTRPADGNAYNLPQIPRLADSPASTAPSTPNDEQQGHRRTGSVALGNEDYFMSALKFNGAMKSVPNTPPGTLKRNATFSPRIQMHDTWPSGEYDRRGEIATCNRLTPMLAQQIKEELNTFKMEMEVHENSKIYTHFF